ncbi:MAG: hypothetical protein ACXIVQ_14775 [Acidimicrobiales bacterium]
MSDPVRLDPLSHWWWVRIPRRLSERFPGLGIVAADGHVLTGLGRVAGVLPVLCVAAGLAVGTFSIGFEVTFTESLAIMIGVLVLGFLSTHLGTLFVLGFAVGNFFLATTEWSSQVRGSRVTGILSQPIVANLILERGPLLIQYALLAALAIAVPLGARTLASSVSLRLRLPPLVHLAVGAVLTAITAFVLARFWASAAPVSIRPVFTWGADVGINRAQPPPGAIEPIQQNETWIARGAALAVFARAAVVWLTMTAPRVSERVAAAEHELLAPVTDRRPARSLVGSLWVSAVYAITGVMLLAGIFDDLRVAVLVFAALFLARLIKSNLLPLPTARWRETVTQVPVLIRFGLTVLIINGVAKAVIDSYLNDGQAFQFMAFPVVVGVLLMAVLIPEAGRTPPADEDEPAPVGATR